MSDIKWTKTYEVTIDTRVFRVFVSQHDGLGFHASCLWYEKGRVLKAPGQQCALQFHLEQRHEPTEDAALSELMSWVNTKFKHVSELKHVQG